MRLLAITIFMSVALGSAVAASFPKGAGPDQLQTQISQAAKDKEPLAAIVKDALAAGANVNSLVAALISAGFDPKEIVAVLAAQGVPYEQVVVAAIAAGVDPATITSATAAGPSANPAGLTSPATRSPALNFTIPSTFGGGGSSSASRS